MEPSSIQTPLDAANDTATPYELSVSDGPITLQVCTRRFVTTRDTLRSGSSYFDALLSSRWAHNAQPDGSFFVDADPDLFAHILRFLRRGVYPVFFDLENGHDHALYAALQEEARFFGIDNLFKWLEGKVYFKVARTKVMLKDISGRLVNPKISEVGRFDIEMECGEYDAFNHKNERMRRMDVKTYVVHKLVAFDTQACLSWADN